MKGCEKTGDEIRADALFQEIVQNRNIQPDVPFFTCYANVFAKKGEVKKVTRKKTILFLRS